jgi:transposase
VGAVFECPSCGFKKDRQLNAGLNIARTVLAEQRELGGLRLDLDALSEDVMNLLYAPTAVGAHGTSGRKGRDH